MPGRRSVRAIWISMVVTMAALAAASASAAPRHRATAGARSASAEPVFYDVSEDPSALKLLALSASGQEGGYTMIDVIDVTRSPKVLFTNTWRIDCAAERMAVVHTVRVEPGGSVEEADVSPAAINTRASPLAFRIAQLACTGKGDLVERRTYRGELATIAQRFWAQ